MRVLCEGMRAYVFVWFGFHTRHSRSNLTAVQTDEQKFETAGRLVQDVLGAIVDGIATLAGTREVLSDVLFVLSCDQIKVCMCVYVYFCKS